ncbi:MAG: hypothetical protein B6245_06735 [Desulfobacteraceae bacterium 4572_88]|nr:MAG: hypothetical protein B6245_06735 [Desulfobacteraceae bacterium 4572_88]
MKWKQWSEFANNESNWRNRQEKGLLKAEYLEDYVLRLWFEEDLDISIYELDFYPLIAEEYPGEVLLPLRDKKRFQKVRGDYTLIWLNQETGDYDEKAVDIAPECIRYFCENYGKKIKGPQKNAA